MTGRSKDLLVSILTPSYNQGRFLPDCLRSVRTQTYSNIEHIIMDGCSTDTTLDVLKDAGESIVWQSRTDGGQSEALNRAFACSTGSIIGWLNSDDAYFGPTAVADAVDLFVRHPEVDVVYGHAALVNDEGLLLHMIWVPPFSSRIFRSQNFIVQPAAFIRRSAINGMFLDETYDYLMDRELWLRMSAAAKFARLPKVLAIDRHHYGRKGETMSQVANIETDRLRDQYGKVEDKRQRWKLWRIATRAWGLSLVLGARKGPFAFAASSDGLMNLVIRQIATPRRGMPTS